MKKTQEKHPGQSSSLGTNSDTKLLRTRGKHTANTARGQKKQLTSAVIYEEGDLRGIVAEALAKSTDPYRALLESGVIKNASEFFDSSN